MPKNNATQAKPPESGDAGVVKVPTATLSRLLGVSDVHLGKLATAGHVFRAGVGQWDLWASIRGYIQFLQKKITSGRRAPQSHTLSLAAAKIEETRNRAERLALTNAVSRGELVSVSTVVRTFGGIFTSVRERILSSDLTDDEKDLLLGDLRGILETEALKHDRNGHDAEGAKQTPAPPGPDQLPAVG